MFADMNKRCIFAYTIQPTKKKIMEYQMNKTENGKFYPTINGKRFNKTNFARKGAAQTYVSDCVKKFGVEKLQSFFN